jgi:hypothetical protein
VLVVRVLAERFPATGPYCSTQAPLRLARLAAEELAGSSEA